jgi:hypothetical protein
MEFISWLVGDQIARRVKSHAGKRGRTEHSQAIVFCALLESRESKPINNFLIGSVFFKY